MPRKKKEFSNNVNFRISDEQKERWNNYLEEHPEFGSLSTFTRWCVDEITEGTYYERNKANNKTELLKRVEENDAKVEKLLKQQREIMKIIAKKQESEFKKQDKNIVKYQQELILNHLEKEPRDEEELAELLSMKEIEVLSFLNTLLEAGKIEQNKTKYQKKW